MIKVRALQTVKGEYGKLRKGHETSMRGSVAKNLAMRGIVEILSEDDGTDPEPVATKGGIRIKDNGTMIMDSKKILTKDTDPGVTGVPRETEKAEADKKEHAETVKKEVEEPKKKQYK